MRSNLIAGEWRPALRGARFVSTSEVDAAGGWPQSDHEDVLAAWGSARAGEQAWRALDARRRAALLGEMGRRLEEDASVPETLRAALALEEAEVRVHRWIAHEALDEALAHAGNDAGGVAWVAPDWRDLARGSYYEVARELAAGRAVVLVSDARVPGLAERVAFAAHEAGLPAGALSLLHGARRELLSLAFAVPDAEAGRLVASGIDEELGELERASAARPGVQARLRAIRCASFEVDASRELEASAAEVVERAFGRATTFSGQLAGSLARVGCPPRLFSRFSELVLERLESSAAAGSPVPQIDAAAAARVRAAWELGLDEGATLIAGGEEPAAPRVLTPSVFTNVEAGMATAQRADPLPVLCLMRSR